MRDEKCNLCRSRSLKVLFTIKERMFGMPGKFIIKKCQKCSLVFVSPRPNKKELIRYYPSDKYFAYNIEGKGGFYRRIRESMVKNVYKNNTLNRILSFFVMNDFAIPNFRKNGKILDVGCGTGETLVSLGDLGWETYGVDIDKNACEIAKKQGVSHVKFGSYETINSYPDNFFDAVRLYHVIEHLDDPSNCIAIIQKKLKNGGQFLFATPNVESFISRVFKKYWPGYDGLRHLFLFSPHTLKTMIERKKLRVDNIQYCSSQTALGVIQVIFRDIFKHKLNLQDNLFFVLITYPLEYILVKLRASDSFIIRGVKK